MQRVEERIHDAGEDLARKVAAPPDFRDVVGRPSPKGSHRALIAVASLAIFLVAGAFAWKAFSPAQTTSSGQAPGVFIAVDPHTPNMVMAAASRAPLVVRNGCVLVGNQSSLELPIWPKGFTTGLDGSGRVEILDSGGQVVAIQGQPFDMGGGYVAEFQPASKVDPKDQQIASVESALGYEIPAACLSGIYGIWQVGDTTPIEQSPPASSTSSAPATGASYLPPHLAGGNGWNSRSSGLVPATRQTGTVAWASTISISEDDVHLRAAIPPTTISELPSDGIVVTVEVVPASFKDTSVPFPYADLSFDLTKANMRGPQAEEPAGNYSVLQMDNADAATLVRVYFGSANPSPELIAKAQAELDTLQLPPTCWVWGEGSFAVSASAAHAAPGDAITLSGRVPFQREDGSYDESGSGQMAAWWNVAPDDWIKLVSGSPSPSPAVDGADIAQLGSAPMNACDFSIPFTVPSVAPGNYPVVVLQEGGGGAALEGSVVVHVTEP